MEQLVYINGEIVSGDKARISALDRGLLYGYGLFETMRSYQGSIFHLDYHLARLMHSAGAMGFREALEPGKLEGAVLSTLKASGLDDARIRLTVTAGEGGRIISPPPAQNPTTIISVEELVLPSSEVYAYGLRTAVASIRRNNHSPLCRMKTLGYLENMLAHTEAVNAGYDEAILLNADGRVAECSASNIFIVETGGIVTPPVEDGVLPGITRGVVIDLTAGLGMNVSQESLGVDRLKNAGEVFITNSVIEIMPVASIDGFAVGVGCRGRVTELLAEEYKKLIASHSR
jgi:branched-chain amino acid aminotransferase